jgi:hypothetical protein
VGGLLAAGTAVALAGTGRLDSHGMIAIPALHDAASDRPLRYTPVCGHTAIPVCLNPAYASYLPAVSAALAPVLSEVAGLPGAPASISQAAAAYQQGPGNSVAISMTGPAVSGTVFHLLLPSQVPGPTLTTGEVASEVRAATGSSILADVIGGGSPAQRAVLAALQKLAGLPLAQPVPGTPQPAGPPRPSTPRQSTAPPLPRSLSPAAQRFAALPAPARHAWLVRHLAALRAGQLTVAQLP